jgi:hypothetical protein
VQAKLGTTWDQCYKAIYGSVSDFMRTHPESFYQRNDGAFYRPDAPSRPPQALPPAAAEPSVVPTAGNLSAGLLSVFLYACPAAYVGHRAAAVLPRGEGVGMEVDYDIIVRILHFLQGSIRPTGHLSQPGR